MGRAAELYERARRRWRAIRRGYEEFYAARYRAAVAREHRDQEELFLLLCFSDLLGVPNPVGYYTLELLPHMLERFHEWHLRQGIERSPLDTFRCC